MSSSNSDVDGRLLAYWIIAIAAGFYGFTKIVNAYGGLSQRPLFVGIAAMVVAVIFAVAATIRSTPI